MWTRTIESPVSCSGNKLLSSCLGSILLLRTCRSQLRTGFLQRCNDTSTFAPVLETTHDLWSTMSPPCKLPRNKLKRTRNAYFAISAMLGKILYLFGSLAVRKEDHTSPVKEFPSLETSHSFLETPHPSTVYAIDRMST